VNDTLSLTSTTGGEECIWASLATSYNYMSPAHVDDDAFLTWEFSTQKKRIYDDHIFQIKKREDYIRKHRLILENYEIAEKKILPVNYEDIDVDVSVNDLQLDKSETDLLAIEPSSDCIEDYPDYMEYIEESPYVPYEVY
jgi:hypothetical protein